MTFNPDEFMSATMSEPSVRRPNIPQGTELRGQLGQPKFTQQEGKQEKNLGQIYTFLEIPITFDLGQQPGLAKLIGAPQVVIPWKTSVDISSDGKGFDLAPGKNNGLRILREALDLNKPGDQFSLPKVVGRVVLATIKHRPGAPGSDIVYDEIGSIARA